jgi:hypothetical protein
MELRGKIMKQNVRKRIKGAAQSFSDLHQAILFAPDPLVVFSSVVTPDLVHFERRCSLLDAPQAHALCGCRRLCLLCKRSTYARLQHAVRLTLLLVLRGARATIMGSSESLKGRRRRDDVARNFGKTGRAVEYTAV